MKNNRSYKLLKSKKYLKNRIKQTMKKKNNGIYACPTTQTKQVRIHKDLVTVLKREQKKQQRVSDIQFGKNRKKVSLAFASKVIGRMLK